MPVKNSSSVAAAQYMHIPSELSLMARHYQHVLLMCHIFKQHGFTIRKVVQMPLGNFPPNLPLDVFLSLAEAFFGLLEQRVLLLFGRSVWFQLPSFTRLRGEKHATSINTESKKRNEGPSQYS